MDESKYSKKSQRSNALYWTVGIILIITMLSVWLLSGLLAKYVAVENTSDSAKVAKGGYIEVLEHQAELVNGVYELELNEKIKKPVNQNNYDKVIPGVDIAKDPFVRLYLEDAEVDYELYLTVTEKDFPTYKPTLDSDPVKTVTYTVRTDLWILQDDLSDKENGVYVYKYKNILDAGTANTDIKILVDDELVVSEHYVGTDAQGKPQSFTLSFSATLKQVD